MNTLQDAIAEWQKLTNWLAIAKDREMTLRQHIAGELFPKLPTGAFAEGTQKTERDGVKAKLKTTWNYKVLADKEASTLAAAAAITDVPLDGLVRSKPELSLSTYKSLPDNVKSVIDNMLEIKQGAIALEIVQIPA